MVSGMPSLFQETIYTENSNYLQRGITLNESESVFEVIAKSKGYTILRRGWPDFALRRADGSLFCVEVKSYADSLSTEQIRMIEFLASAGIPCYVSKNGEFPDLTRPEVSVNVLNTWGSQAIVEEKYHHRLALVEDKLRQIRKLCEV